MVYLTALLQCALQQPVSQEQARCISSISMKIKSFVLFLNAKLQFIVKKKYKGISSLKALKRLVLKCIIFLDKLFICFEVTNNIYSSYCRTYLICQPTYFSWSQEAIKKVFTLSTCTFIYAVI